jgi:hypothetical protein
MTEIVQMLFAVEFLADMQIVEGGILAAPVAGWCAAGQRAKPKAWAVHDCHAAPKPPSRGGSVASAVAPAAHSFAAEQRLR